MFICTYPLLIVRNTARPLGILFDLFLFKPEFVISLLAVHEDDIKWVTS